MSSLIDQHREQLKALCRTYGVRRLEVFGSAAEGPAGREQRDLDFLVDFHPLPPGSYPDAYFGLLESLQAMYGKPVDLVIASAIRNPFFRQAVDQTKTLLYAA